MTRLIQRMALRLLSAGAFSFCSLTLVSPLAAEPVVGLAQVRPEAIKVELALLSDSIAYAQPLTVRAQANGVEIQGTVSSEAVRQHIIQLARRNCSLPILDKVAVAGAASQEMAPIVKAAHARLVRELGTQADAIRIQSESGKLRLSGKVRSLEDKLHASRTLRSLPGCAGLVNQLEVKAESGPSFTLITHSSEEPDLAPVTPPKSISPSVETPTEEPSPDEPKVPSLPPKKPSTPTLPSGLPANRVTGVRVDSPDRRKDSFPTILYAIPTGVPGAAYPSVWQSTPGEVVERPSIWNRLRSEARPQVVTHRPAVPTVIVPTTEPAVTTLEAETPSATPEPATKTVWPPAHRTVPVSTPAPAGASYQSRPLGNLTRPQVVTQPASTRLASQVPAPIPEVVTVSESKPVELKPEVVKPIPKAPAAPKPDSGNLLRKVKAACGTHARNVRIETGPDGVLAVHVYATPGSDQLLTTKLFDVPELAQSNVRLHVHLAP